MAVLKTCPNCQGAKKVRGLGMMSTDCPICDGLGKVDPSVVKFTPRTAAVPLKRDALPEDYYEQQRQQDKRGMSDANCAYKNYPKNFEPNKETQNTPAGNKPVQNAPQVLNEAQAAEVRAQIKDRAPDDNIGMPKVALSAAVKAELEAMEKAKSAAEAEAKLSAEALANVTDEEMFGGVQSETTTNTIDAPKIVAPVVKQSGEASGKKSGRQTKKAQG